MSQRLARSLNLTVDLYNPKFDKAAISKRFQGAHPSSTPTVVGAKARIISKYDVSKPNAPGRSNVDQMDTTDEIRLEGDTPCGDNWFGVVTGPADYPEVGTWFRVMGGPKTSLRSGAKNFLIVRATKPAWIS